ncbi:MAG TPA: DUF1963 domain-containing protein [Pirellulales bacterium]|nr:DUF1963 domain-containing protein [Pirellulales bacterium]
MSEPKVDLDAWVKRCPLDVVLPKLDTLDKIQSPLELAMIEQIRQRTLVLGDLGTCRPADSLVFIRGEAPGRFITKLGGAPYRPAHVSWPLREDAVPMTFLAQFCFAHSKDILPNLPGEMLLIFARDDDLYMGDPPCFHFEWQPEGLRELIEATEVPMPMWPFVQAFAARHRTVDFENDRAVANNAKWAAKATRMHPGRIETMLYSLARLPGGKIGGLPHWLYPEQHEGIEAGPILCALSNLEPRTDIAPPPPNVDCWTQKEEFWEDNPEEYLNWRDGCQINFFLTEGANIHWNVDFG